jgi:hypothetical protein
MPMKNGLALKQLLGYERFRGKVKLAYIALNIQMPCPPRSTRSTRNAVGDCFTLATSLINNVL